MSKLPSTIHVKAPPTSEGQKVLQALQDLALYLCQSGGDGLPDLHLTPKDYAVLMRIIGPTNPTSQFGVNQLAMYTPVGVTKVHVIPYTGFTAVQETRKVYVPLEEPRPPTVVPNKEPLPDRKEDSEW